MRRGSAWPTPTALAAARRADRCGRMAGVDGRASNPRERGGGGEGNGTTLPARKRACRARRATSPRGVQPVGANESAARVGQVLEDLDQKLDGGEDLHVGVEIVAAGSVIDHGVRAPLVDEQFLERDRRCVLLAPLSWVTTAVIWSSTSRLDPSLVPMRCAWANTERAGLASQCAARSSEWEPWSWNTPPRHLPESRQPPPSRGMQQVQMHSVENTSPSSPALVISSLSGGEEETCG